MARITMETLLPAETDLVWSALQRPELLHYVSAPILTFRPIEPGSWPDRWRPGEYLVKMRFLGLLPIGRQVIDISFPSAQAGTRLIRDNGRGGLASRWDHLISVTPVEGGTRYVDMVEIEAGALTAFIVLFAHMFYRHRQRRWHRLVKTGFDAL